MTSTVMRRLKFAKKIKRKSEKICQATKNGTTIRSVRVALATLRHDCMTVMTGWDEWRVTSEEWHNERTTGEPSSFPAQLKHLSLHITHLIWSRLSHCLCHCKTNIEYTVHTGQKHNTCHLTWPHWPEKQGREAHHPTHPGPLREDRGSRCQTL